MKNGFGKEKSAESRGHRARGGGRKIRRLEGEKVGGGLRRWRLEEHFAPCPVPYALCPMFHALCLLTI